MKYKVYTSSVKVLADLQTPVGIYLKMRDLYPESVLLESSDFHGGENSYSFIGLKPVARFCLDKGVITQEYPNGTIEKIEVSPSINVPEAFQGFVQTFEWEAADQPATINGFFGYTSYDAASYFESVNTRKEETAASAIPEMLYIYYRYIIIVNHFKNELTLVENLFEGEESHIQTILNLLENRNFAVYDFHLKGEETS
ncbi:MAG: anthranilate synthase component I family protein, partial [Dysgonamonadaceae bacterium]|nr:anthranilate synthase component I family protein [Dysgonamonadaceae bacterium]